MRTHVGDDFALIYIILNIHDKTGLSMTNGGCWGYPLNPFGIFNIQNIVIYNTMCLDFYEYIFIQPLTRQALIESDPLMRMLDQVPTQALISSKGL